MSAPCWLQRPTHDEAEQLPPPSDREGAQEHQGQERLPLTLPLGKARGSPLPRALVRSQPRGGEEAAQGARGLPTGPTHTSLPQMLHLEPTTRNLPLSGVKGSLIT